MESSSVTLNPKGLLFGLESDAQAHVLAAKKGAMISSLDTEVAIVYAHPYGQFS